MDDYAEQVNHASLESVRRELARRCSELKSGGSESDHSGVSTRLVEVRDALIACRDRTESWACRDNSALRGGLKKTYRRACDRLGDSVREPTTERLHQLRKRVKYHCITAGCYRKLGDDRWRPRKGGKAALRPARRRTRPGRAAETVAGSPSGFGAARDVGVLLG